MAKQTLDRLRIALLIYKERGQDYMSSGQLAKNRVSNNASGVKRFFSGLRHALEEERHFALMEISAIPTQARS